MIDSHRRTRLGTSRSAICGYLGLVGGTSLREWRRLITVERKRHATFVDCEIKQSGELRTDAFIFGLAAELHRRAFWRISLHIGGARGRRVEHCRLQRDGAHPG